jgi:hypothetical protein
MPQWGGVVRRRCRAMRVQHAIRVNGRPTTKILHMLYMANFLYIPGTCIYLYTVPLHIHVCVYTYIQ